MDGEDRHLALLRAGSSITSGIEYRASALGRLNRPLLLRLFVDVQRIGAIYRQARKGGIGRVAFLSCNETNLWAIKFWSFLYPEMGVDVFVHGILEQLARGKPFLSYRNPLYWDRILFWFGFSFLAPVRSNVRMVLLSGSFKERLRALFPKARQNWAWIDLPIPGFAKVMASPARQSGGTLKLAWVGILNRAKGAEAFCELVERVSRERSDVEFHLLGFCNDPGLELPIALQLHGPRGSFLPESVVSSMMEHMDMAVFTYPPDSYQFTASGALVTALGYGLPILALRNAYFAEFMEQNGTCGLLCDSMDEMQAILMENRLELTKKVMKFRTEIPAIREHIIRHNHATVLGRLEGVRV